MTDLEWFRNSMTHQPRDRAPFHECPLPTHTEVIDFARALGNFSR
jgi:hypothetical protein